VACVFCRRDVPPTAERVFAQWTRAFIRSRNARGTHTHQDPGRSRDRETVLQFGIDSGHRVSVDDLRSPAAIIRRSAARAHPDARSAPKVSVLSDRGDVLDDVPEEAASTMVGDVLASQRDVRRELDADICAHLLTLELTPPCEMKAIGRARKRVTLRWHPDRAHGAPDAASG
jgi:hypothetical protein